MAKHQVYPGPPGALPNDQLIQKPSKTNFTEFHEFHALPVRIHGFSRNFTRISRSTRIIFFSRPELIHPGLSGKHTLRVKKPTGFAQALPSWGQFLQIGYVDWTLSNWEWMEWRELGES